MTNDLRTHQILSATEFAGVKAAKAGVIVNLDKDTSGPKKRTAHDPWCMYPTAAHFEEKVDDHEGKNGAYYYFLRLADAEAAMGEIHRHDCA